jgi:hypothetical protein
VTNREPTTIADQPASKAQTPAAARVTETFEVMSFLGTGRSNSY